MLDSEEYLHLAISATQSNDHHSALNYLHKALETEPANAKARFLLGAEYAELGLTERAISELEQCLSLDGTLELAAVQLAILYIAAGKNTEAVRHLTSLTDESNSQVLRLFAAALKSLTDGENESALEQLDEVLRLEITNIPLLQTIKKIREQLSTPPKMATKGDQNIHETQSVSNRLGMSPDVLRAYERPSFEDDDE